jgi:hypothetical protein
MVDWGIGAALAVLGAIWIVIRISQRRRTRAEARLLRERFTRADVQQPPPDPPPPLPRRGAGTRGPHL